MEKMTSWNRTSTRIDEYTEEAVSFWNCSGNDCIYLVTVREFFSEWGSSKHVTIFKEQVKTADSSGKYHKEPNMAEKRFVLNGVEANEFNSVAFEIFPAKNKIVDKYDVYHLWVVQKHAIPFFITLKPPRIAWPWKTISIKECCCSYTVRIYYTYRRGLVKVYFLKAEDGSELKWYDKQNFKDFVIGEETVAVEFITDQLQGISALVCVPNSVKNLPFGLR